MSRRQFVVDEVVGSPDDEPAGEVRALTLASGVDKAPEFRWNDPIVGTVASTQVVIANTREFGLPKL